MKRKRYINTHQINNWKYRLNMESSRMNKWIHYDKVYSLVAGWISIRILSILVELEGWKTMQVYYIQDFP